MANVEGCLISVELANFLKEKLGQLPERAFRCPQCHQPVVPFKGKVPHFEHVPGNPGCLLSH